MEFLTHGEFFGEAQDAAVTADEQSLRGLPERGAATGDPRCLDRHAESHAVALAEAVGNSCHRVFHGIAKFQTSMQSSREPAGEESFVVPTNNVRGHCGRLCGLAECCLFRVLGLSKAPRYGAFRANYLGGNVLPLVIQSIDG